jgi:hypothetical protein
MPFKVLNPGLNILYDAAHVFTLKKINVNRLRNHCFSYFMQAILRIIREVNLWMLQEHI